MKKLSLLSVSTILLVGTILISSCKKDDMPPTISLVAGTGLISSSATVAPGDILKFSWSAAAGKKDLTNFTITKGGVNLSGYPKSISGSDYNDVAEITAELNEGQYIYAFKVTDKADLSGDVSVTITVEDPSTPFTVTKTGQFYHVWGTLKGAYDLVNNVEVAAGGNESDKDMKNTDLAGVTFTGNWTTGTGNSTQYVKVNTYDYTNADVETATDAYAAGSPSSTVSNPAVNDIYIVNLRGAGDYAVLKITALDPGDNTCGGCTNPGKITFEYKKN